MSRLAVAGVDVDILTRCAHWHSPHDIVAIKMKCCGVYYACKDCHEALADHAIEVWPRDQWHKKAVQCGACRSELAISDYVACKSVCPRCRAPFNPGCRHHHRFYFDSE